MKVGESSPRQRKREKGGEKCERRDIRSILRRREKDEGASPSTSYRHYRRASSTRRSRPFTGWKQRITRRENRLTRLAIDPTGNLSRPSLFTRRANKGEIPRPFRGIKYLGAIYLLRSFLSVPSLPRSSISSSFFSYLYLDARADAQISPRRNDRFSSELRSDTREGESNRSLLTDNNTIKAIQF